MVPFPRSPPLAESHFLIARTLQWASHRKGSSICCPRACAITRSTSWAALCAYSGWSRCWSCWRLFRLVFGRRAKTGDAAPNLEERLAEYPDLKSSSGDRRLLADGVPVRLRLVVVAQRGKRRKSMPMNWPRRWTRWCWGWGTSSSTTSRVKGLADAGQLLGLHDDLSSQHGDRGRARRADALGHRCRSRQARQAADHARPGAAIDQAKHGGTAHGRFP